MNFGDGLGTGDGHGQEKNRNDHTKSILFHVTSSLFFKVNKIDTLLSNIPAFQL
jgi:hypothetical protein